MNIVHYELKFYQHPQICRSFILFLDMKLRNEFLAGNYGFIFLESLLLNLGLVYIQVNLENIFLEYLG